PPPIVAPITPATTLLPLKPPMSLGLVVLGSTRRARCPKTLSSSAWLSVVPRKFVPGVVPALPVRDQPAGAPVLAIVSVWPEGVIVMLDPGASVTAPERLFTVL